MCGIAGIVSNENNAFEFLHGSLRNLENRGRDSSGICCFEGNDLKMFKHASDDDKSALDYLKEKEHHFSRCNIGIGHTRWATHGERSTVNAHPHLCYRKRIALVHNGIIDNYLELKRLLGDHGIKCVSETDSEVVVNMISLMSKSRDLLTSIKVVCSMMKGTWSIVVIAREDPHALYFTRSKSPMIVAIADNKLIVSSEVSGLGDNVKTFAQTDEGEVYRISLDSYDSIKQLPTREIKQNKNSKSHHPYKHFTIKEIFEQKDTVKSAIAYGKRITIDNRVVLDGLEHKKEELIECQDLILLGCGTSYNAAAVAEKYFEDLNIFNRVKLMDGADFDASSVKNRKTAIILISQSGETKDLHRCIEICKEFALDVVTLGVVNVEDSIISQETDCGVHVNAEREVGVASTKSFTSQVLVLIQVALWFHQYKKPVETEIRNHLITQLSDFIFETPQILKYYASFDFVSIAKKLVNKSLFVLGKGKGCPIADEGALKIKELSYIHAEGYSYSSLKHGPLALIEKDTPVIFIANDENMKHSLENSIMEVKSRLGKTIVIGFGNADIPISIKNEFSYLWANIALQLLAYHLAVLKGHNPDKPRNLAKVVTVL